MDYINAFWVGGLICALVQILMEKTKMLPGRIMVLLVCLGAVLGALQILSAIHRVRGSRCKCAAARLWKYTLERRKGSSWTRMDLLAFLWEDLKRVRLVFPQH